MPTTVLAFGGNALCPDGARCTYEEQRSHAGEMAAVAADLVASGHRTLITHGNGPQAGHLAIQQESAAGMVAPQPLHSVVAMTQGQLGSMVALSLRERMPPWVPVVVVVSHVRTDRDDPAMARPTKPIGPFYDRARATSLAAKRGWSVAEVELGQYRRVVPSPAPRALLELPAIERLVADGAVVVAAGGGGIPVVDTEDGGLAPVDAVVDKDLAAERLGSAIQADNLVLLTGVAEVALDYGTARQRPVHELTVAEAKHHLAAGQFPAGSMGPKVTAAVAFLEHGGRLAVITSPEHAKAALAGHHGTRIVPS
ncbi:MAG TPA: carbamate kinase [Jiangellaceae bacterium]|nr:carbamate kinase [Jiangellaceae bacterium]